MLGPSGLHSKLVLKLYSAVPSGRTLILGESPRTAPLYSTRTDVISTLFWGICQKNKSSVRSWLCDSTPGSEFLWQQLGSVTRTGSVPPQEEEQSLATLRHHHSLSLGGKFPLSPCCDAPKIIRSCGGEIERFRLHFRKDASKTSPKTLH